MLFLIQISSVLSDTDYTAVGMSLKGQEQLPQGICRCPAGGLSATPLRGGVPAHWTVRVEGTGIGADAQQPAPD